MSTYYHGSHSNIARIDASGLFGGLFVAAERDVARSHGPVLHAVELEDEQILTQHTLSYDADYERVKAIVEANISTADEEEFDAVWDVIVEDKSLFRTDIDEERLLSIFRSGDLGAASWEAQRIRGLIAAALGFQAVEMNDEHGTTVLVLPGTEIRAI